LLKTLTLLGHIWCRACRGALEDANLLTANFYIDQMAYTYLREYQHFMVLLANFLANQ